MFKCNTRSDLREKTQKLSEPAKIFQAYMAALGSRGTRAFLV